MKHKVIIMGELRRKEYYYSKFEKEMWDSHIKTGDKIIWEGELDFPINIYESIRIDELNATVSINSIKKTTSGIVYYTDYVVEVIEDEITKESLEKAEKSMKEHKETEEVVKVKKNKKLFNRLFNKLFK